MDDQSVLIVEEGPVTPNEHLEFLRSRGYAYVLATSAAEALESLSHRSFRFTLLDLHLKGTDVASLIQRMKLQCGEPGPIVGITRRVPDPGKELDAAMLGVDALLYAPFVCADIDKVVADVVFTTPQPRDSAAPAAASIRREIDLWRSPKMRDVRQIISEAAGVDVTVLIMGETGTGKEVVARAVHHLSTRRTGPFVKVNCAAVPRELLESELFGHERGAFTGAHKLKVGKFESAHNGTIFLDEIGDLHSSLQGKLLHVLQDGDFSRVGGKSSLRVDVRVIAATNQDLERAVTEGRFREDLYYRLDVVQINVPPLRERVEEIPDFVEYFVQRYSKLFHREGFTIPPATMDHLLQHRYRGNVRELENLVKRMIVLGDPLLSRSGVLPPAEAAPAARVSVPAPAPAVPHPLTVPLKDVVRRASIAAERDVIRKVLEQTGWNRVRAAKVLRISYRGLLYKMKRVGLRDEAIPRRPMDVGVPDRREFPI
jgi:two-component system response regulator AtoC